MELVLEKQPRKYLASIDAPTRAKLYRALDQLKELEGDIVRLAGTDNLYRFKLAHYRIIFAYHNGDIVIRVIEINTRTNIKYRRYR